MREKPTEGSCCLGAKGEGFRVLREEEEEREGGRAGEAEGEEGGGREGGGEEGGEEEGAHPGIGLGESCGEEAVAEGGREGPRDRGRVDLKGGDEGEACLLPYKRVRVTQQEAAHKTIQDLSHFGRYPFLPP